MEFKARKVLIDPDNPYQNDSMSRSGDVENISVLLRNTKSPMVLSINAPWGFGKTTFLEMLHADLNRNDCGCVFFSAWETDFAGEPLLAFLGEMNQEISSLIADDAEKSVAWSKVKVAGSHIIKKGIPAAIRFGTAGIVDIDGALGAEISSMSGSLAADLIEEYSKNKDAIAKFKGSLRGVLQSGGGDFEKLYIFIDELDRCRPTYALELLERMKHLFDIEGLVFVLALDTEQLSHSVKAVYGSGFDSNGYLKRFIDIEYSLRAAELGNFIDNLYELFDFDSFFQSRKEYIDFRDDHEQLRNTFLLFTEAQRYSLRDVEQLIARTNLVLRSTEERTFIYPALLVFLIVTKESNRDAYMDFINPDSSPDRIIAYLHSLIPRQKLVTTFLCALIEAQLFSAKGYPHSGNVSNASDLFEKHSRNKDDEECERALRDYSIWVLEIVHSPPQGGRHVHVRSLVDRIELLEKFKFVATER